MPIQIEGRDGFPALLFLCLHMIHAPQLQLLQLLNQSAMRVSHMRRIPNGIAIKISYHQGQPFFKECSIIVDCLMRDPYVPFLLLFDMSPHSQHVEVLIFHAKRKKPGIGRGIGRAEGVGMRSKAQHTQALVGIHPNPMSKRGSALFDMLLGTFLQQNHIWVQNEDVFLLGSIRHITIPRNNSHS